MASGQSFGNSFKKSASSGALLVGNSSLKCKCDFDTFDTEKTWEVIYKSPEDIVEIDGNVNGASYLKIVKDPRYADTRVELASRSKFKMPFRMGAAISLSQRQTAQEFTVGYAGINSTGNFVENETRTTQQASSISQSDAVLTVNFSSNHNLVVGDRINILYANDSRLNHQSALVTSTPTDKQITVETTTYGTFPTVNSSPPGQATIKKINYGGGITENLGLLLDGSNASNAISFRRSGLATEQKTGIIPLSTNFSVASVPASPISFNVDGAYAFSASTIVEFRSTQELTQIGTIPNNSAVNGFFPFTFTSGTPGEGLEFKMRFTANNLDGFPVPVGRIVSSTKSGTNVATVVTDVPHNLTTNSYVVIYGNRVQTNFANLTSATRVISIIDSTTFTISYGAAVTASTTGGAVFLVNGNNLPTALPRAIFSVEASGNKLSVVCNSASGSIFVGEHVCLHGLIEAPTMEGIYKVFSVSGSNLVLVPAKTGQVIPNLAVTNTGGAVIKCTDYRLHAVRVFDFARSIVETEPSLNRQSAGYSVSVTAQGAVTNNNAALPNPVLTSAVGVSANPTAGVSGRQQQIISTLIGAQISKPYCIPEAEWSATASLTTTSDVALQTAAGAGLKRHITSFWAINTGAATVTLSIKDGTTVRASYPLPVNVPVNVSFPSGIVVTANTALNAALSAAGTVQINATGYTAP